MRRLDVSRNPLGNEAGVAILGALVNECTQHLDVSYTELKGGKAGRAIGGMLRCHTIALQHINLEHNALGRDGVNEASFFVFFCCVRARSPAMGRLRVIIGDVRGSRRTVSLLLVDDIEN